MEEEVRISWALPPTAASPLLPLNSVVLHLLFLLLTEQTLWAGCSVHGFTETLRYLGHSKYTRLTSVLTPSVFTVISFELSYL